MTNMFKANFTGASLFASLMIDANLLGAEFQDVPVKSALFSGADLLGATYSWQLMTPDSFANAPKMANGGEAEYIFKVSIFMVVVCPDGSDSNDNLGCGFAGVKKAELSFTPLRNLSKWLPVNEFSTDPSILCTNNPSHT